MAARRRRKRRKKEALKGEPEETLKEKNKIENGKPERQEKPPSNSAFGGDGENKLELWRRKSEDLARYSASELGDQPSFGFHIKVWNHARKADRQRPDAAPVAEGMFAILQNLIERRQQTGQPQGKAWTRRVRKLFEENECPMLVKSDEAERQEVRAALKDAPFFAGHPAGKRSVRLIASGEEKCQRGFSRRPTEKLAGIRRLANRLKTAGRNQSVKVP